MSTLTVHAAPSEYVLERNALQKLQQKLQERGIQQALIITGKKSWKAAEAFWPEMPEIEVSTYTYNGECSLSEIEKVANMMEGYDAIIAVGGGKVIDLAKAAANEVHKPIIAIPTIASNCAPWTPLSVLYDDKGSFIRYDVYPVTTSLLLVEPEILLHAPRDYFVAGIGDTLVKWYEADVQLGKIDNLTVPMMIAYESAKQCKEILLAESVPALQAIDQGEINDAFIKVVEVMFMYAGMVGGFGDHYGRTAGAHSIHNGMTVLEESHALLHGVKVAYGICVQLMLEERTDEIKALKPFYKQLGLPQTLAQMGLGLITDDQILQVAAKSSIPQESIHLMPIGPITAERVAQAMKDLEQLMTAK